MSYPRKGTDLPRIPIHRAFPCRSRHPERPELNCELTGTHDGEHAARDEDADVVVTWSSKSREKRTTRAVP